MVGFSNALIRLTYVRMHYYSKCLGGILESTQVILGLVFAVHENIILGKSGGKRNIL